MTWYNRKLLSGQGHARQQQPSQLCLLRGTAFCILYRRAPLILPLLDHRADHVAAVQGQVVQEHPVEEVAGWANIPVACADSTDRS